MFSKQSQGFFSFHKNPTRFSSISKTHDKVIPRILNMFSQILDFEMVIKTFVKYHKVFLKKIQQDFQQISSSKFSKKKKKKKKTSF